MKKLLPGIAAVTAAAFLASCSSTGSGPTFSELFDDSAAAEGTGIQFSGVVRAVVILATHNATARQRQVAEQNGRRAVARLKARSDSTEGTTAATKKPAQKKSGTTASAPAPHEKPQKKLPRYIAVDTEKDQNTSPKAKKAVMIWDTQSESVVGNNVYDVQATPPLGAAAKFDTYSAEYVGSGG